MNSPTTYLETGAHCAPDEPILSVGVNSPASDAAERLELTIAGMTCGHCIRAVTDTLEDLRGVTVDHVRIGKAVIWFEPDIANPAAVIEAIRHAGYRASFGTAAALGVDEQRKTGLSAGGERRRLLSRGKRSHRPHGGDRSCSQHLVASTGSC